MDKEYPLHVGENKQAALHLTPSLHPRGIKMTHIRRAEAGESPDSRPAPSTEKLCFKKKTKTKAIIIIIILLQKCPSNVCRVATSLLKVRGFFSVIL